MAVLQLGWDTDRVKKVTFFKVTLGFMVVLVGVVTWLMVSWSRNRDKRTSDKLPSDDLKREEE